MAQACAQLRKNLDSTLHGGLSKIQDLEGLERFFGLPNEI